MGQRSTRSPVLFGGAGARELVVAGEHGRGLALEVDGNVWERRETRGARRERDRRLCVGGLKVTLIDHSQFEIDEMTPALFPLVDHLAGEELGVAHVVELADRV